jgi:hypothetical protein
VQQLSALPVATAGVIDKEHSQHLTVCVGWSRSHMFSSGTA